MKLTRSRMPTLERLSFFLSAFSGFESLMDSLRNVQCTSEMANHVRPVGSIGPTDMSGRGRIHAEGFLRRPSQMYSNPHQVLFVSHQLHQCRSSQGGRSGGSTPLGRPSIH